MISNLKSQISNCIHPRYAIHDTRYKLSAGFTIVEVLISLTIFSIAVAGVITVAVQGNLNVNAARNRVTASYLADEGIELMRALRDTAVVSAGVGSEDAGWNNFVSMVVSDSLICSPGIPCDIDPTDLFSSTDTAFPNSTSIVACSTAAPYAGFCPLVYNASSGYYTDRTTDADLSGFSRSLTAVQATPNAVLITSKVQWPEGTITRSVTQSETLYNWYH